MFCAVHNNLRITLPGSRGSSAFHFSSRCVLPHAKHMSFSPPSHRPPTQRTRFVFHWAGDWHFVIFPPSSIKRSSRRRRRNGHSAGMMLPEVTGFIFHCGMKTLGAFNQMNGTLYA